MKWFGEDGKLLALPDPVREVPSRPPIIDDEGPALTTAYKHVRVSVYECAFNTWWARSCTIFISL